MLSIRSALGALRRLQHADAVGLGPLDELLEAEQVVARLGAGRGQRLARHHRDHDEVDDRRRDDERQRHQRIDPAVERGEPEHDDERRARDGREDRERAHAPAAPRGGVRA